MPAHSFPSDAICKRRPVGYAGLWFRGNFAFGWFTDLPDYLFGGLAFCSFSRLALGLDRLRSFAFFLFGSLDLRHLGGFALCLPRRLALGFSRSVALRPLGSFTLRSLDGFEPRLLCCLALRLLRSFAPGF